jgi:uncharacterized protein Yka (UPF0111/DUF47 family)
LFNEGIAQLVQVSELFQKMVENLGNHQEYFQALSSIEQKGDLTTRAAFDLLHKTFITPFDRYDIHRLVSKLDQTIDSIHITAVYLQVHEIGIVPPELVILANLSIRCSKMLQTAINRLNSLEHSAEILKSCDAISDAEDTAQELLATALARLFKEENDLKYLMKINEIYKNIKKVMEGYQELGNIIRTIVLEYA